MNLLKKNSQDWLEESLWYYRIMNFLGLLEKEEYNSVRTWL